VRLVAKSFLVGSSLETNGPDESIGKPLHPRVLFSKADAARE
jgi:hypothetical protein